MKMRRSLCIVAALVAVIGLASAAQDPEWWKTSILYQIYPRSFADSDSDGNGDLKGILDHVPYLKELGVGIVWLSPIYASPMGDQGYDVSDFKSVNPLFGNLSDAIELIKACQREGIRFFMDFVPNHSSNEHAWFNLSRHRDRDYEDFYIWKDAAGSKGGQPIPPNNWVSMFNAVPAWTYDNVRKQFYLHQFAPVQPDLNYRNTRVVDAMYEQMKFWLDLGVDGFRMDAVPFLVEDSSFKDEPKKDGCTSGDCNVHIYTQNQPETYSVLQQLDDRMSKDFNNTKFLFLEVYASPEQTMKYFYKRSSPFNFIMIQNVSISTNATEMKRLVDSYLGHLPENAWPNWVTGNHDNSRVGTRFGEDFVDAANMLTLLLPGASVTFQGEELGMLDTQVPKDRILDCCGRDPERTPFQWNNSKNAGFSSADRTWLPVNPNYVRVNVADEDSSGGNSSSHLQVYRRLATLRKELAANISTETATIGDWVFLFTRTSPGGKVYYVVINMNNEESEVSLKEAFSSMPAQLVVHTASLNLGLNQGQVLDTGAKLKLRPRSGMVVSGSPAALPSAIMVLLLSTLAAIFSSQN